MQYVAFIPSYDEVADDNVSFSLPVVTQRFMTSAHAELLEMTGILMALQIIFHSKLVPLSFKESDAKIEVHNHL